MKNMVKVLAANGLFLILFFSSLMAQETTDTARYRSGGFGHFFIGPAFYKTPAIETYLKKSDVLGSGYSMSGMAYSIGGEGGAMIERIFVGGGGFTVASPITSTDLGSTSVSLGGGYFKMGYKFYEKPKAFMFAYASLGGSGYNIELSNLSDSVFLNFNHKYPIAPSQKKTYTLSGFLLDFGVSMKTIPIAGMSQTKKEIGGFMVGMDIGVYAILPLSRWTTDENVVTGPPTLSSVTCPYVHFTIGGGGFGYKQK